MAILGILGLGNIGSNLVRLLGRFEGISRIVLVDPDSYEKKNLAGQEIMKEHIKKDKAKVQAELLKSINSGIDSEPVVDEVQNVPWGTFSDCDVILGCFDNNMARLKASEMCFRLGIPYVDAGIRKDGLFARVDVYVPGSDGGSCLECSWSQDDYERLEINCPCDGPHQQAATDSPLYLGSMAASIQAAECAKILSGNYSSAGSRIVVSADSYRSYISRIPVNEQCRFDHMTWNIEKLDASPDTLSVQEFLGEVGRHVDADGSVSLSFRKPFYLRSAGCDHCSDTVTKLNLDLDVQLKCRICGKDLTDSELRILPEIDLLMPENVLAQTLSSIGLRSGDIVSVMSPEGKRHYLLGSNRNEKEEDNGTGNS